MLAQDLLVIVRIILRPTIRVIDEAFGWRSERNRHLQSPDCQVPFHPIARGPTNNAAGMQVQDDCEIQPTFTRPDIADVTSPLLVWVISVEVAIQQVRHDVELVVTVCRDLVLACSNNAYAVLAHQSGGVSPWHTVGKNLSILHETMQCPTVLPAIPK